MKTIQYKDMGARIRAQRERLGYTREQLAEKLDVSTKFCSDIELGIRASPFRRWQSFRICSACGQIIFSSVRSSLTTPQNWK